MTAPVFMQCLRWQCVIPGNTKGESINVPLTSCLTGLDLSVLQIKTNIVSCHTADSKPVKQEVNGTVILPPLEFPAPYHLQYLVFPPPSLPLSHFYFIYCCAPGSAKSCYSLMTLTGLPFFPTTEILARRQYPERQLPERNKPACENFV
jgi:hypothetical protein